MQIPPCQTVFCLILTQTSSFENYLFVPGPLGGLKSVQGDVSGHTDSIGSFERIFVFRPKMDFFPRGNSRVFFVKNDQILK